MIPMISLSISGSSCSNVLGQSGYGELVLDVVMMAFATLASQDVASVYLPVVPSSRLRFFKEGGVIDSRGGMFSLALSQMSCYCHSSWEIILREVSWD